MNKEFHINEEFKEKVKVVSSYVITYFKDKVFLTAIALSLFIWILFTLSGNFTTGMTIPVNITGGMVNSDAVKGNSVKKYLIDCKVNGNGFGILRHKLFTTVELNTSDLEFSSSEAGDYVVDPSSLEKAISNKLNNINIQEIYHQRVSFISVTHTSKRVPVELNTHSTSDGLYTQYGDIVIDPAEVVITGPVDVIEPISSIKTMLVELREKKENLSGQVKLQDIPNVKFSSNDIYYALTYKRFIEKRLIKKVEIKGSKGEKYSVIPSEVEVVLNVSENIDYYFNQNNFPIYVDIRDRESDEMTSHYLGDNKFFLTYNHLPKGITVRSIEPRSVTVLEGRVESTNRREETNNINRTKIHDILNQ